MKKGRETKNQRDTKNQREEERRPARRARARFQALARVLLQAALDVWLLVGFAVTYSERASRREIEKNVQVGGKGMSAQGHWPRALSPIHQDHSNFDFFLFSFFSFPRHSTVPTLLVFLFSFLFRRVLYVSLLGCMCDFVAVFSLCA